HLTGVGIPIPVTGNVDLTLEQEGTSKMMCMSVGEVPVPCSDVFSLQNGTITGVADGAQVGDATVGGFPYYCTMTGTLDCPNKKLDNGWIQCTYCIGPLADGGMSCSLLDGVGGTTGVGGHFAGPRSEEHTSELQSLTNLVCRLLLEKIKPRDDLIPRDIRILAVHALPGPARPPPRRTRQKRRRSKSVRQQHFQRAFFCLLPQPQNSALFPFQRLFI